jgi:hypothetical protein
MKKILRPFLCTLAAVSFASIVTADCAAQASVEVPGVRPPANEVGELWLPNPQQFVQKIKRSRFQGVLPRILGSQASAQRPPLAWTVQIESSVVGEGLPELHAKLAPELWTQREKLRRSAQAVCSAADAYTHLDLQQVLLQLQPWATSLYGQPAVSGWQRGAGLHLLSDAFAGVSLPNARTLELTMKLLDNAAQQGVAQPLRAALAPPLPARRPAGVGTSASFVTVNVFPQRLWQSVEQQVAYAYPLQYSLFRMQLDALEQQEKVRWVDDVLGPEAQQWTAYAPTSSGHWVASLGLHNARAGSNFLRFMAESAALLNPAVSLSAVTVKGTPAGIAQSATKINFPGGEVFFICTEKELLVSDTQQHLRRHLRGGRQGTAWAQAPLKQAVGLVALQPDFLRQKLIGKCSRACSELHVIGALTSREYSLSGMLRLKSF